MRCSVVILAKNEEKYLDTCLAQFEGFADEIVYGDMQSTDNSVEIARKYTDRIFYFEQTDYLDSTKSKLCEHAIGEWILVVDADEIFPRPLLEQLKMVAENDAADVLALPRQIYIFRQKIRGMHWQGDIVERFFKKGHLTYSEFHHTPPKIIGRLQALKRSDEINIIHYWVDDWATLVRKLTYYTQGQAEKLDRSGVHYSNFKMLLAVSKHFLSRYIKHYGFLNGWLGLKIAVMMSIDVFLTHMRLEELQKQKKNHD